MSALHDSNERLRRVITRNFPAGARIIGIPRQADLVFAISWKLKRYAPDDPGRSRTIRLAIADDIVEHYVLSARSQRRTTEAKIGSALREMLAAFDPVPPAPGAADVVRWQISLADG